MILLVLVIFGLIYLAINNITKTDTLLSQDDKTRARQQRIADALLNFASLNARLPCPAQGAVDTGVEAPGGLYGTCMEDAGVVPWLALGIAREDALDGSNRKISYRVFSGANGFTSPGGLSMVDCNKDAVTGVDALDVNNRCRTTPQHSNTRADYLLPRGAMLQVVDPLRDPVNPTPLVAYALISHGDTGLGAYLAEGGGRSVMPSGTNELLNANAAGTYHAANKSATGVLPTDAAFFDDVVYYKLHADLVREAKLEERTWPYTPPATPPSASSTFDAATVAAAIGGPATNNTGDNVVDFGAFSVQAFGSTARNVSFDQVEGEGIGAIGGGSTATTNTTINSATNEFLRFTLDTPARSLGITLVRFGTASGDFERVQIQFRVGAVASGAPITKTACQFGDIVRANFVLTHSGNFTGFDVRPIRTASNVADSTLLVGALATCDATVGPGLCVPPGAIPLNDCP